MSAYIITPFVKVDSDLKSIKRKLFDLHETSLKILAQRQDYSTVEDNFKRKLEAAGEEVRDLERAGVRIIRNGGSVKVEVGGVDLDIVLDMLLGADGENPEMEMADLRDRVLKAGFLLENAEKKLIFYNEQSDLEWKKFTQEIKYLAESVSHIVTFDNLSDIDKILTQIETKKAQLIAEMDCIKQGLPLQSTADVLA